MGVTLTLPHPFGPSGGYSTNPNVPSLYPVAIGGLGFLVDTLSEEFTRATVPLLKAQQDTGEEAGERSLNPAGLWRRARESWHLGAGQTYLDRAESSDHRFRSSKGVDVWTKWQLSLLPTTASKRASANTNLLAVTIGSFYYLLDGAAIVRTADITAAPPVFVAITGGPAAAPTSIATDGFTIYTAHTADGIYASASSGTTTASYATGTATLVAYVKGRLMAAGANSIYNIVAAGAFPAALFTHANTNFAWVGFAAGANRIYAAGFSGDKSEVYRIGIKADGLGLDAAIPATAGIPDGEIIRWIDGYLGFILLGTDKGVRVCSADSNGDLTLGALIPATSAVRCFEGQDRYVWYGLTNYDSTSTGLGRLDMSTIGNAELSALAPAYASDLMSTAQGAVLSVATMNGLRVFTVSGVGVFAETTDKVPTGTLDTGVVTFGIPHSKVSLYVDLNFSPLVGTITPAIAADSGTFAPLTGATRAGTSSVTVPTNQVRGGHHELRFTLARSATAITTGPTLLAWTLLAHPAAPRTRMFTVPLILTERIIQANKAEEWRDPLADLVALEAMLDQIVSYQEGGTSETVIVEDLVFRKTHPTSDGFGWNGTCLVRMKTLS